MPLTYLKLYIGEDPEGNGIVGGTNYASVSSFNIRKGSILYMEIKSDYMYSAASSSDEYEMIYNDSSNKKLALKVLKDLSLANILVVD